MPRQKGSKNKVTTEVKERLVNLIDECINSIGGRRIKYRPEVETIAVISTLCSTKTKRYYR